VLFVVVTFVRGAAGAQGCRVSVRKDQTQVADILGCSTPWSVGAKLRCNVALPQIGRLHDMHVAVEDFESVFCHSLLRFLRDKPDGLSKFERMRVTTACQASTATS